MFSSVPRIKDDVSMLLAIEQKYQGQRDTSKMAPSDLQTMAMLLQELAALLPESGYGGASDQLFNDIAVQSYDKFKGDDTLLDGSKAADTSRLATMISIENGNGLFAQLINDTNYLNNLIPND